MSKPKFEIDDAVRVNGHDGVFCVISRSSPGGIWPAGEWVYSLTCGITAIESALTKASLLDDKAIKAKTVCFGQALEALKMGKKVSRSGWNGKGMWLGLVKENEALTKTGMSWIHAPWIGMKTTDGKFLPWLASQTDLIACDWCIMSEEEEYGVPDRIPVPENIKFKKWDVWSYEGNKGTLWGLCSPNKKLALFTKGNVPLIDSILNTYRVTAYLVPCKRSDLKPGDIAFRAIAGVPNGIQDFTIHHEYCVILNEDESAYWYNEMDMKVDGICGGVIWYKVIFE